MSSSLQDKKMPPRSHAEPPAAQASTQGSQVQQDVCGLCPCSPQDTYCVGTTTATKD